MRRLRRERGMTQETLSLESGLMQSYLSEVEAGKRNVSVDSMATIAAALGVSMAALFDEPTARDIGPRSGAQPSGSTAR